MSPAVCGNLHGARNGEGRADKVESQAGMGILLHMAQCMRPCSAASVGAFTAFASEPTAAHTEVMRDVVRYVPQRTCETPIKHHISSAAGFLDSHVHTTIQNYSTIPC